MVVAFAVFAKSYLLFSLGAIVTCSKMDSSQGQTKASAFKSNNLFGTPGFVLGISKEGSFGLVHRFLFYTVDDDKKKKHEGKGMRVERKGRNPAHQLEVLNGEVPFPFSIGRKNQDSTRFYDDGNGVKETGMVLLD